MFIFNKSDASTNLILKNDIITRYTVGGIPAKSEFSKDTTIQSIIIKMLGDVKNLPIDTSTPNTRYEVKSLGILSTNPNENTIDLDDFLIRCSNYTGYYGASIGSTITIKDGTYNKTWVIVGFDCEHNRTAADGSTYDNGYGIFMIPTEPLYNSSDMIFNDTGYVSTGVHKSLNSTTAEILMKKSILNNHLIKRHVLLSNKTEHVNGNCTNTGYAWTNAYFTLMSAGQITGTFASNTNKYDDGEANYKLPYFNFNTWQFRDGFLRGLRDNSYLQGGYTYDRSWYIASGSELKYCAPVYDGSKGVFPLIMIR